MEALFADQDRKSTILGGTVLVGSAIVLCLLFARLVHINTSLRPQLLARASAQQAGKVPIRARRGCILDAAGRLLAGTKLQPSIYADPALIEDEQGVSMAMAPLLDISTEQVRNRIAANRGKRFCWIKRNVTEEESRRVKALGIRGVGSQDESVRHYPMGATLGSTLGIVTRDGSGIEGLELVYDDHLRDDDGSRAFVCDGGLKRRPVQWNKTGSESKRDGGHVVLTLDSVIQEAAESALVEQVEEFDAVGGVAVVMDPHTADVLALAQYPDFDPNKAREVAVERRRNRAICDAVEPGSTFKPFVACAYLEEGDVDPEEEIFCHNGVHYFGGRRMRDSTPHGQLNFDGIIARSSNIGMGFLAQRIGNEPMYRTVRAFGFGEKLGVKFPGESPGLVHPFERWNSYSTTSIPIGQEIGVTPMQLASAFSAIVNGGSLLRPRLVRALLDRQGDVIESFDGPDLIRPVVAADIASYMTEHVLVGVVENGGGKRAALDGWQMLGKTGTAQIPFPSGGGYEPEAYIGSFMGAAPAEDPRCVVLVMIHRPDAKKGYYGGLVAAPAVKKIMTRALDYFNIPKSHADKAL